MHYTLLIYEDEQASGKNENSPAFQDLVRQHMAFSAELARTGVRVGGAGLKSAAFATTIRNAKGGRTVHDGPFAESKEQVGGYYVINVPDLDAAIEVAKRMPLAEGSAVEIRPTLGGE